jgi:hypothetical protein
MRLTLRNLLFTGALLAGIVFLYALQNSRKPALTHAPVVVDTPRRVSRPARAAPTAAVDDVLLPSTAPTRSFDRYRQFGLPSATDMLLYFPTQPGPIPALRISLPLKKL